MRALVLGAAVSGRAASRLLARMDVDHAVYDRRPDALRPLASSGVETVGGEWDASLLAGIDLVVTSPGFSPSSVPVRAAEEAGIPVWSEVELGLRRLESPVLAVTGTNGKTTVVHMIESVARAAGERTGVVGTLGARIAERVLPTHLTTPEASDLQRQLAMMRTEGVETALIEVSSHGLALGRVDHLRFELAVFTNLGHDHLDFHGSQEDYYLSKERLFSGSLSEAGVVWIDDEWGRRLADRVEIPVTTVGTGPEADVRGEMVSQCLSQVVMECHTGGTTMTLEAPIGGRHNGQNSLLAAAVALRMGFSPREVSSGIAALPRVEGRFELVAETPAAVVVDYAHTPGAIGAVIGATRSAARGRVIAVIGAGGDRDRSKRIEMARAVAAADCVMLTSDNPRSEDPEAILADLAAGLEGRKFTVEADRKRAIHGAVGWARPGDAVLILGKGHEQHQEVDGERIPFDDRQCAREALAGVNGAAGEVRE